MMMKKSRIALVLSAAVMGAALASLAAANPKMKLGWEFCVTHGKTPTLETAKRMIGIAASLGYEQIHLFSKAAFLYERHPEASVGRSPYTWADVRELVAFAESKGVEMIPYQASFSHMEPWLDRPEYRSLAEAPEAGVKIRWGFVTKHPMGLCATDPRSLPFLEELWDELLPNFKSQYFNVGCDEFLEYDDGGRRSAAAVKEKGALVVYTDFLRQMDESIRKRGKTMMFWADIVIKHPEMVDRIPKTAVLLDWGYNVDSPFDAHGEILAKSGHRFWVCPGTSGWNSYVGVVDVMKGNASNAYRAGVRHGAEGLLMTTWGDGGHPSPWIVELPGLVYAAALVREGRELTDAELAARLDRICGCRCGEALLGYGYLAQVPNPRPCRSVIADVLRRRTNGKWLPKKMTDEGVQAILTARRAADAKLDLTGAPDWVRDDFRLMGMFIDAFALRAKGDHARVVREMPGPYAELWLRQNRPGGLETSIELNLLQSEPWTQVKKWN